MKPIANCCMVFPHSEETFPKLEIKTKQKKSH